MSTDHLSVAKHCSGSQKGHPWSTHTHAYIVAQPTTSQLALVDNSKSIVPETRN